jgi:hypothetical protein
MSVKINRSFAPHPPSAGISEVSRTQKRPAGIAASGALSFRDLPVD